MASHKKPHWTVQSIQRSDGGAVVTLTAGPGRAFDCDDLKERWPRSREAKG